MQFSELQLSKPVQRAVKDMQFSEMTPIQEMSIPPLLDGKDVIGQAKTGTGKTAAFMIPAIESIDTEIHRTQVLVLCPTRELAIQICEETRKFTKYTQGIACDVVYGGEPIDRQIRSLRKHPAIVIGTPGRVLDHIRRRVLRLKNLKTIILDEADEMLNMGFRGDIETVLASIPAERQTVLFSATMPKEVLELAKGYQKDPVHLQVKADTLTVNNIEQYYIDLPKSSKMKAVEMLLAAKNPKRALVFCNTKRQVDILQTQLLKKGLKVDCLHGDMSQKIRTTVMSRFKKGELSLLIATDVAARGIDVKDVEIVINYDIPNDMDFYIHRIGRTARAGKTGLAVTFACGAEQLAEIRSLERFTNSKIRPMLLPGISIDSNDFADGAPLVPKRNKYQPKKAAHKSAEPAVVLEVAPAASASAAGKGSAGKGADRKGSARKSSAKGEKTQKHDNAQKNADGKSSADKGAAGKGSKHSAKDKKTQKNDNAQKNADGNSSADRSADKSGKPAKGKKKKGQAAAKNEMPQASAPTNSAKTKHAEKPSNDQKATKDADGNSSAGKSTARKGSKHSAKDKKTQKGAKVQDASKAPQEMNRKNSVPESKEDLARHIAIQHAKKRREEGSRPRNDAPKMSLEEYFKMSEEKSKAKSRTRYNGFRG